jgi:hypothetical protein
MVCEYRPFNLLAVLTSTCLLSLAFPACDRAEITVQEACETECALINASFDRCATDMHVWLNYRSCGLCRPRAARAVALVDRGGAELDWAGFRSCMSDLKSRDPCGLPYSLQETCFSRLVAGKAAIGDPCIGLEDCGPGLVCESVQYGQCSGHCVLRPLEGEECFYSQLCAWGLTCSEKSVCTRPPSEGEPCVWFQCADGLVCRDKCRRPVAATGDPASCGPIDDTLSAFCASDEACIPHASDGTGICVKRQVGDACNEFVYTPCPINQWCELGKCREYEGPGESCGYHPYGPSCGMDSICIDDMCVGIGSKGIGDPCEDPDECASGSCSQWKCVDSSNDDGWCYR